MLLLWLKLFCKTASMFKWPTWSFVIIFGINWNLFPIVAKTSKLLSTYSSTLNILHMQDRRNWIQSSSCLNDNSWPQTSYRHKTAEDISNTWLLNSVTEYILLTKRFDNSLLLYLPISNYGWLTWLQLDSNPQTLSS